VSKAPTTARQDVETGTEQLLCHIEDHVAVVTLNRPEARNALSAELRAAVREVISQLAGDPRARCLVLTGAGGAFCSGGDTKVMARQGPPPSQEDRGRRLRGEQAVSADLHEMPKPTLAALPGPAAGAGFSLALACDLRIAAESAFVTTSYVRVGLAGDYGGAWLLTQIVGTAKARELFFTSARVDAKECERLGIANRVVPDAALMDETLALARQIASGPPVSLGFMKGNLNRALDTPFRDYLDIEADRMVRGAFTEDYKEAMAARVEKREPVYRGR
jgi:enoyl-CoA hydratase/carnithine racemase